MIRSYEDFEVFQRSYKASLAMHKLSLTFPKIEQFGLANQLRRATKSIPMNIAEGYGKDSTSTEFKRYLSIALGSNNEVRVQLKYCKDLGYITPEDFAKYDNEYKQIGNMLYSLRNNWK